MNEKERIELLMKCYGLTPSQFAERTGIQRASVSHIISGRNKPSLEVLQKIYEAFPELDARWLMAGKGEEPVAQSENKAGGAGHAENSLFAGLAEQNPQAAPPTAEQRLQAEQTAAEPRPQTVQHLYVEPEYLPQQRPRTQQMPKQQAERQQRRSVSQKQLPAAPERRIKEVRIYFSDGTYETLVPEK